MGSIYYNLQTNSGRMRLIIRSNDDDPFQLDISSEPILYTPHDYQKRNNQNDDLLLLATKSSKSKHTGY
jgi:hypothetical protein